MMTLKYRVMDAKTREDLDMSIGFVSSTAYDEPYVLLFVDGREICLTVPQARILAQDLLEASESVAGRHG